MEKTVPEAAVRYLVVANVTLGSALLEYAVYERHLHQPAEFFLLVPATTAQGYPDEHLRALRGQPLAPPEDNPVGPVATGQARLHRALRSWRAAGIKVSGQVGQPDPVRAVLAVLSRHPVDEVLVSTLEPGISRWVRMDLVSRLRRKTGLPVSDVVAANPLRI